MRWVRSAARAVILHEGQLLTIRMEDRRGRFHVLPGGGQRHGETLHEALRRECREELGAEIVIGPLLYVREYIGKNHSFADRHRFFHQIESLFRCGLADPAAPLRRREGDRAQTGIDWIALDELEARNFHPKACIERLREDGGERPANPYLGDCN